MTYDFHEHGGYAEAQPTARKLPRTLQTRHEALAALAAARDEAVAALADQLRAQRDHDDDRTLIASEVKRQYERPSR